MITDERIRELFEKQYGTYNLLTRKDNGEYDDWNLQLTFNCWEASAKAIEAECQQQYFELIHEIFHTLDDSEDCGDTINITREHFDKLCELVPEEHPPRPPENKCQQELAAKEARIQELKLFGKRLSFAAQTSGGVAGRDDGLVNAIDAFSKILSTTDNHAALDAVIAAEREACAKLCDEIRFSRDGNPIWREAHDKIGYDCAEAIRARSNHE